MISREQMREYKFSVLYVTKDGQVKKATVNGYSDTGVEMKMLQDPTVKRVVNTYILCPVNSNCNR